VDFREGKGKCLPYEEEEHWAKKNIRGEKRGSRNSFKPGNAFREENKVVSSS